MMPAVAFLFDVDNTLLDNDRFEHDLQCWLEGHLGADAAARYWAAFEIRRQHLGYADFLGAVQQCWDGSGRDLRWVPVGEFILDYPFAERLYPDTLDVLGYFSGLGPTWLITDGDGILQPRKLHKAGLWDAVEGRVRIYTHKERRLADIQRACPASHYVLIDDKIRILDAVKQRWQGSVTTVLPQQGHYATRTEDPAPDNPPDIVVSGIGDLPSHPGLSSLQRITDYKEGA